MPSTAYSINTAAQCLTGNSFSFTNSSAIANGTLTHLWSFGDGGTATTLNATKTYSSAGTYTVKLVSTSNNGCKDSTTRQVTTHPMPSTSFNIYAIAQCLTGNNFNFTNGSSITSGTITSYLWSFGDGGTASTLNATKTYSSAGTYSVKLVSTSNNSCKDSTTRTVTVHPMPVAGFTVSPSIQCLTGNSFSFTNSSTVNGGTTTSNWTFGNGSTSTSQSPTNSYLNIGTYTVKLVSTSNNGCKDSTTRDVRVDPSPTATLTVSPYRSIYPGLLTTISASITPTGTYKYTWYRNSQIIPTEITTVVDSIGYLLWSGPYKMTIENLPPQLPCANTTSEVIIGDSASSKLFIYPNPNNGQFRVTYYSPTNTRYQVVVMDTKGAVLYRKPHEVTNRYQLIDINLIGASRGMYILQIQDPTGKQLAAGKLVIQ
jgi:PKD repeat protein